MATSRRKPAPPVKPVPRTCSLGIEVGGVAVRLDDVPWEHRLAFIAELVALRTEALAAHAELRPRLDHVPGSTCATAVYDDEWADGRGRGQLGFRVRA